MSRLQVAIVDYGMGNLRSVANAFKAVAPSISIAVTSDPTQIAQAERVVFPGQGAMPDCIRELDARDLRQAVIAATQEKPFLGICIGLQMLFEHSEEGDVPGLGVYRGEVKRFPADKMHDAQGAKLKVPHMGWSQVHQTQAHALWAEIPDQSRFYYVHSYYVAPAEPTLTAATTAYPFDYTGAIARDNVFAVQFHPEKSANAGLQLLRNFVHWKP
ncbi:imidazole glycerol phosphate synthase subunit HisH [Methylophilus sp.]|jgi:imidazole glycerol-phosphate synthase subunit HisH|uniref:imidazole glycerol phosphate synthase subunit HisH n=1 Tax=Methylophilus sp. TaxID=29541 RepID=UPI0011D81644|nr:imidazole glycerol phosphate synthase subunit HisH [Methylophilus sp.]TXI44569.1 MAG: imidazole glycerol phosphate synthase subunit HisH [Methylophilus sp.]